MRCLGVLCVAVIVVAGGGCSNTERNSVPPAEQRGAAVGAGGAGANLESDGEFVQDVANKNMVAKELSRLALDKAASADVKAFAQGVIGDADAADAALKNTGAASSNAPSAESGGKQREQVAELASKQGPDFDREYVKTMVEGYQDLTAKLESRLDVQSLAEWKTAVAGRAQSGALPGPGTALADVRIRPNPGARESSAKLNQWAADTYPNAQKQLDTARRLENAMKDR